MFENISASYDVGIAKKYGINCAVLLNKLVYLSKYTSRKDGYCWRTSKELEDELGLSRYQQDIAIKKLIEENLIETKNTYIIGTQIKCKHFKLLFDIDKCDLRETNKSTDCMKTNKCDLQETNRCDLRETNKSVNNNKTSNNINNNNKYIYGEFNNVKLTDDEYNKLKEQNLLPYIEKLSSYIASKGKRYKSHYATILNWSRKEKKDTELPEWYFNEDTKIQGSKEMENIIKELGE